MVSTNAINNTLTRSFAFASSAFTLTTLISILVVGFGSNSRQKAYNKIHNVPLIAFVLGGGLGLVIKKKSEPAQSKNDLDVEELVWRDWRDFEIFHKHQDSKEITSFYFQAVDGKVLPHFKPGQFLTIKLDIPGESRPVIRSYSFSDFSYSQDYYRLSIKREGSPQDLDVPPGIASNFMHNDIEVGSTIACKPPNGKFFLEVESSVPAVLISNGVGITPMVAMAKACAVKNPRRHIWFIHGARNGEYHALREEMNALEKLFPSIHLHYCYSRPRIEDSKMFHHHGYANTELIAKTIIPQIETIYESSANAEYYLCGSSKFMDSLIDGLAKLGVAEENVFFESFGGGKTKGKSSANNTDQIAAAATTIDSAEVVFSQSDLTVTWKPDDGTLLELAQANGIEAENSCCQGICMICMRSLEEGEVEYVEPPADEPEADSVLVCIAKPKTARVVIDL